MIVNGWALLCHEAIIGQLTKLAEEYDRACKADPNGFTSRANVKLFAALSQLMGVIESGTGIYRALREKMVFKMLNRWRKSTSKEVIGYGSNV
jgi:hypothetical protein